MSQDSPSPSSSPRLVKIDSCLAFGALTHVNNSDNRVGATDGRSTPSTSHLNIQLDGVSSFAGGNKSFSVGSPMGGAVGLHNNSSMTAAILRGGGGGGTGPGTSPGLFGSVHSSSLPSPMNEGFRQFKQPNQQNNQSSAINLGNSLLSPTIYTSANVSASQNAKSATTKATTATDDTSALCMADSITLPGQDEHSGSGGSEGNMNTTNVVAKQTHNRKNSDFESSMMHHENNNNNILLSSPTSVQRRLQDLSAPGSGFPPQSAAMAMAGANGRKNRLLDLNRDLDSSGDIISTGHHNHHHHQHHQHNNAALHNSDFSVSGTFTPSHTTTQVPPRKKMTKKTFPSIIKRNEKGEIILSESEMMSSDDDEPKQSQRQRCPNLSLSSAGPSPRRTRANFAGAAVAAAAAAGLPHQNNNTSTAGAVASKTSTHKNSMSQWNDDNDADTEAEEDDIEAGPPVVRPAVFPALPPGGEARPATVTVRRPATNKSDELENDEQQQHSKAAGVTFNVPSGLLRKHYSPPTRNRLKVGGLNRDREPLVPSGENVGKIVELLNTSVAVGSPQKGPSPECSNYASLGTSLVVPGGGRHRSKTHVGRGGAAAGGDAALARSGLEISQSCFGKSIDAVLGGNGNGGIPESPSSPTGVVGAGGGAPTPENFGSFSSPRNNNAKSNSNQAADPSSQVAASRPRAASLGAVAADANFASANFGSANFASGKFTKDEKVVKKERFEFAPKTTALKTPKADGQGGGLATGGAAAAGADNKPLVVGRRKRAVTSTKDMLNIRKSLAGTVESIGNYKLHEVVGKGASAMVRRGTLINPPPGCKDPNESFAVKILYVFDQEKDGYEISVMQKLPRHKNVAHFRDVVKDSETGFVCIILELLTGGTLLDKVQQSFRSSTKCGLCEHLVHTYCTQMFEGIAHCHLHGVAHRDIKLENLLIAGDGLTLKLCDFGLATCNVTSCKDFCGTPKYMAPEIFNRKKPYNPFLVDAWSCGIVAFGIYAGYEPLGTTSADVKELMAFFSKLVDGSYHVPIGDKFSAKFSDLVTKLLQVNPANRLQLVDLYKQQEYQSSTTQGVALNSSPSPVRSGGDGGATMQHQQPQQQQRKRTTSFFGGLVKKVSKNDLNNNNNNNNSNTNKQDVAGSNDSSSDPCWSWLRPDFFETDPQERKKRRKAAKHNRAYCDYPDCEYHRLFKLDPHYFLNEPSETGESMQFFATARNEGVGSREDDENDDDDEETSEDMSTDDSFSSNSGGGGGRKEQMKKSSKDRPITRKKEDRKRKQSFVHRARAATVGFFRGGSAAPIAMDRETNNNGQRLNDKNIALIGEKEMDGEWVMPVVLKLRN